VRRPNRQRVECDLDRVAQQVSNAPFCQALS
jgi:hypothetical protein